MSQSAFKPTNKLEEVLIAACTDTSARPEFYRQLIESELYLLTPDSHQQEGRMTLEKDTRISFVNFQGANGTFLPIFTSRERLQESVNQMGQTYGFLVLRGESLFSILTQHPQPAVLNPGAAYGKELTSDEIKRMVDGSILKTEGRVVQKATQVLLGQPAKHPIELIAALQRLFAKQPSVEAAYLAQIHDPSSGEKPHLIIGIEASGDFQKIVGEAGVTAQGLLGKEEFADFIQVGGGTGSFDSYFKKQTKPFYQGTAKKPFWKVW